MSISTAKLDTLYRIASFLGEPAPGCSKQFEFAQLASDRILLLQLKKENLPLFSFLNQREITPIDQSQGLVAELDRIRAIFRDIHVAAKNNLTAAQFNEICANHASRNIWTFDKKLEQSGSEVWKISKKISLNDLTER